MSDNLKGLILSCNKGVYTVKTEDTTYYCRAASKISKSTGKILAGDRVEFSENKDGTGFITSVLPRKNSLVRPPVANIDLLCIVVSPKEPDPFIYNIDLLTVLAEKAKTEAIIIVTKNDLDNSEYLKSIYEKTHYRVITTSSKESKGINEVREALKGKICVLCGASGVGKSSLLNTMYPFLKAETGELSKRISRGKNTTRTTELFPLENNTFIADSPGFSAIETEQYFSIDCKELCSLFPEFAEYSSKCRYSDCTHTKEKECAVAKAAEEGLISTSRLENYRKLYEKLRNIDRYK